MTVGDDGGAADYLERVCHAPAEVRPRIPRILFAGHTLSGSRLGEYRFQSGSKWSVCVRALVTRHGTGLVTTGAGREPKRHRGDA